MRNWFKPSVLMATIILNSVLVVTITTLFVSGWHEHSKFVQEMVDESMQRFEPHDIDYTVVDRSDTQELIAAVRDVTIYHANIFRVKYFRDESYAYRDAVYDLFPILLHDPENTQELEQRLRVAHQAQMEFYGKVERFMTNQLIAMWYTF